MDKKLAVWKRIRKFIFHSASILLFHFIVLFCKHSHVDDINVTAMQSCLMTISVFVLARERRRDGIVRTTETEWSGISFSRVVRFYARA